MQKAELPFTTSPIITFSESETQFMTQSETFLQVLNEKVLGMLILQINWPSRGTFQIKWSCFEI